MTHYVAKHNGPILSVETTNSPDAMQACIQLRSDADVAPTEAQLAKMGRTVMSRTTVNGHPMLVTSGARNESECIEQLSARNGALVPKIDKKPFDAWKARSILGMSGQALQLTSSLMKKKIVPGIEPGTRQIKNSIDAPLLTFAGSNMAAAGVSLIYRAQKRDDPHQLLELKNHINASLAPHMAAGTDLLDVNDHRALLRERNKPKAVEPIDDFMRKNSVNVGELGLRYVGAIGMAFPVKNWSKAGAAGLTAGQRVMSLRDKTAPLRSIAGFGSLVGKTMATTSLMPDPYNHDKKHTFMDGIREKYSFLAGGLVEAVAFSVLTYDAFTNTKPKPGTDKLVSLIDKIEANPRSLIIGGKPRRDWLSAIGGTMFVGGYIVRSWAHFGDRQVNMTELYAHASDTLALLPPAEIPQGLANTAAYLADHFKKDPTLTFSTIYNRLSDDLARSHQIAIKHNSTVNVPQLAEIIPAAATAATAAPSTQVAAPSIAHVAPAREIALSA